MVDVAHVNKPRGRFAAAEVAVDLLFDVDAAPDVGNDLGGEFYDMERVKHRAGILQLVVDDALVAVKWAQRGYLD